MYLEFFGMVALIDVLEGLYMCGHASDHLSD